MGCPGRPAAIFFNDFLNFPLDIFLYLYYNKDNKRIKKGNDEMIIYLDCDGTWIDLYGVNNWLDYLIAENPYPYIYAKPLVNFSSLARIIHKLQANGIQVGVISWLSKNGSADYNRIVTQAKLDYFKRHLPSVVFDEIHIVPYGTPKSTCTHQNNAILFDDEESNIAEWISSGKGMAYNEKNLIAQLKKILIDMDRI